MIKFGVEIIMMDKDVSMKRIVNDELLKKAIDLDPKLIEGYVKPSSIVEIDENGRAQFKATIEELASHEMKRGDSVILDFGDHQVGYISFNVRTVGSPQDAPVYLKLKFGEIAKEIIENSDEYDGWISRAWIQEEHIHIDVAPTRITLPRRYAFRFMEIFTIDTSAKFKVVIENVECRTVTSVDLKGVSKLNVDNERIRKIDEVSIKTLQNCMQSVYEDGPKRDRRLWIGDLRLQALANYATFKDLDSVKRCLYLFAALTRDDGAIGSCLFIEPEYIVDDTFFFDYSLFFINILADYYRTTGDFEIVKELWPAAYRQIELSRAKFDGNDIFEEESFVFIDWKQGLNKQASGQAVYIYALNDGIFLADVLEENDIKIELEKERQKYKDAAIKHFWDPNQGIFVSGKEQQISYASQVWMILAKVVEGDEARNILKRIIKINPEMGMVTPYMNHHFVDALISCGEIEKALDHMNYYWGGMLDEGADTFWELYNPENSSESPYGSSMVNSYCHAWSCTPTYHLRQLHQEGKLNDEIFSN